MTYRVDLTKRAVRNLRRIYLTINAEEAMQASVWFNGLEKAIPVTAEIAVASAKKAREQAEARPGVGHLTQRRALLRQT